MDSNTEVAGNGYSAGLKTKYPFRPKNGVLTKEFFLKYSFVIVFILLIVYLSFATTKFLTTSNVINVFRQISYQGIIAVGMTMILIMGQIDLSVGALVAFAAVLNALFLKAGLPIPASIVATLVITSLWGGLNGYVTARFRLHAFLVTMATMTLIRGVTYTLTSGYPVGGLPRDFFVYGSGQLGFVPFPILYMLVIFIAGTFVLSSTPFGRSVYAIGGNEDAARLSGINVKRVKIGVFIVSAFVSAISGLVLSSRLMAGSPEIGIGWELDIVAAVIIGGTNILGGEGKLTGTLLGVLFIGVLSNGMILLDITPYMQQVVRGLVILSAVVLNSLQEKR
jgi:ribose transport system permease protein